LAGDIEFWAGFSPLPLYFAALDHVLNDKVSMRPNFGEFGAR